MMFLQICGLCMAMICAIALAETPASPGVMTGAHPFTPELFAQLGLTPQQSATAGDLANAVNRTLQVRIYQHGEFDDFNLNHPIVMSAGQLIAVRHEQIRQELSSRHPDAVLIANLSAEIASLQQMRQTVIANAYTTLYAMLTPAQRVNMPQLAALLQTVG